MPLVADLLETCIDDVIRTPVPMATAGQPEDAGPSMAASASSLAADDTVSLAEAAARLKQLELDSPPLPIPSRPNINLNMNMNNQEDVVKLTEKCLNSVGSTSSPVLAPLRPPEDLKSNILKAQVEAALKGSLEEHVGVGDKNTNLQEAASSVEVLAEDLVPSAPMMPSEVHTVALQSKAKAENLDLPPLQAMMLDNLIDFSDPSPVLPPVPVQPKPLISPRWIVPSGGPPVTIFTNGLLDPSTKTGTPLQPEEGALASALHPNLSSQTPNVTGTSTVAQPPKEVGTKTKGLLTTEL